MDDLFELFLGLSDLLDVFSNALPDARSLAVVLQLKKTAIDAGLVDSSAPPPSLDFPQRSALLRAQQRFLFACDAAPSSPSITTSVQEVRDAVVQLVEAVESVHGADVELKTAAQQDLSFAQKLREAWRAREEDKKKGVKRVKKKKGSGVVKKKKVLKKKGSDPLGSTSLLEKLWSELKDLLEKEEKSDEISAHFSAALLRTEEKPVKAIVVQDYIKNLPQEISMDMETASIDLDFGTMLETAAAVTQSQQHLHDEDMMGMAAELDAVMGNYETPKPKQPKQEQQADQMLSPKKTTTTSPREASSSGGGRREGSSPAKQNNKFVAPIQTSGFAEEFASIISQGEKGPVEVLESELPEEVVPDKHELVDESFSGTCTFMETLTFVREQLEPKKAVNAATTSEQKVLEIRVKKLFSVAALSAETASGKKDSKKDSKKIEKEKKRMEKLMKEGGIEINQEEQANLVKEKQSKESPGGGGGGVTTKDKDPLFFVRVTHCGLQRQSNFFLSSESSATEDVLHLPVVDMEKDIQCLLCGSSGAFGPGCTSMLGMTLVDSPAKFIEQKVVELKHGRHTVELRATLLDATPEAGRAEMASFDAQVGLLSASSLKEREEAFENVKTVLEGLLRQAPPLKLPPNELIKRLADIQTDMQTLCDLIVSTKYVPPGGLGWRTINGNHLLHLACLAGHARAVNYLTHSSNRQRYPAQAKNNFGAFPIHYAVLGGSREALACLLDSLPPAAQVEQLKTPWLGRRTALHLAAMLGRTECVKELLSRKCPMETRDLTGSSPLMLACFSGALGAVHALLERGANPASDDEDGNTCLMVSILRGFPDVCEALLSTRSGLRRVGIPNSRGDTPIWTALLRGDRHMIDVVVRALNRQKETMEKAGRGEGEEDEEWVAKDAQFSYDIDMRYEIHGNTILHRAVMFIDDIHLPGVIEGLGASGSLKMITNVYGQYPIQFALALGKMKAVEALTKFHQVSDLAAHADVDGNTLLHFALTGPSVDWVIQTLKPQSLEVRNKAGFTPLMTCSACGTHNGISALLANEADPSEKTKDGRMALALAAEEVRNKSALVLPYSSDDDHIQGSFRIASYDAPTTTATPSNERKRTLTAGLSRRGSLSIKKGAVSNIIFTIAEMKF